MAKYADYKDRIDHLIEIRDVYDGWSVAVLTDGTRINRWENDEGTGPEPGYERRYFRTGDAIRGIAGDLFVAASIHMQEES